MSSVAEIKARLIRACTHDATPAQKWRAVADLLHHAPWDVRDLLAEISRLEERAKASAAAHAALETEVDRLQQTNATHATWIAELEARDPRIQAIKSYVGTGPDSPRKAPTRPATRPPPPIPRETSRADLDWADSSVLIESVIAKLDSEH